ADTKFAKLRDAYFSRSIRQRTTRGLSLGEGDDVANAFGAGHQHHQPIQTEGYSAVRRAPELQRPQQETELLFRLVPGDLEQVEYRGLHCLVVNTDRASAEFRAVQHHVISS